MPSLAKATIKSLLPSMLRSTVREVFHGGWRLVLLFLAFQAITVLIALPVIHWLFKQILHSAGLRSVDMNTLGGIVTKPQPLVLFVLLILAALLWLSLQLAVLLMTAARIRATGTFTLHNVGQDAVRLVRKMFQPGSLALLLYLFVILPLSHFGFLSALTRTIAIPEFISGELMKSTPGLLGYTAFMVVLFVLNVRLALVLPVFALTDASGFAAYRLSWRLTRHAFLSLVAAVALLFAAINIGTLIAIIAATSPTLLSDLLAPQFSPMVAAGGLALAEIAGLLMVGFAIAGLCALLIELLHLRLPSQPQLRTVVDLAAPANGGKPGPSDSKGRGKRRGNWRGNTFVSLLLVVALAVLTTVNVPIMERLQGAPATMVLAHRGFVDGGVENTIPALEAAAKAGALLVEMDVMETKDAKFVVMHDANLDRLAGRNVNVAELTLAELTAIEVRDESGHKALIPSLQDYLLRAKEISMPLLVEIKLHGKEGPNLVPRLVAEMESLDTFEDNIFHSLDKQSVEELKQLRPNVYTGYIMPLAGVEIPDTTVDFVVIEESSYSPHLRDDSWDKGKEIFVWTVNTEEGQRTMIRDDVDGIITDAPDTALASMDEIGVETGLYDNLFDAVQRFVTVI